MVLIEVAWPGVFSDIHPVLCAIHTMRIHEGLNITYHSLTNLTTLPRSSKFIYGKHPQFMARYGKCHAVQDVVLLGQGAHRPKRANPGTSAGTSPGADRHVACCQQYCACCSKRPGFKVRTGRLTGLVLRINILKPISTRLLIYLPIILIQVTMPLPLSQSQGRYRQRVWP